MTNEVCSIFSYQKQRRYRISIFEIVIFPLKMKRLTYLDLFTEKSSQTPKLYPTPLFLTILAFDITQNF